MKAVLSALLPLLACLGIASPARAQNVSVGVTITGEVAPGVYGQVVLGNRPPPPVLYAQPVIATPVVVAQPVPVAPLYLHVPPGHAKHWRRHCQEYHACDRPVYFVRSAEYEPGFNMERWRAEHEHDRRAEHEREHADREHGERERADRERRDHEREHDER
jgi:hypothetical protein